MNVKHKLYINVLVVVYVTASQEGYVISKEKLKNWRKSSKQKLNTKPFKKSEKSTKERAS
jgi:hypothetical protein